MAAPHTAGLIAYLLSIYPSDTFNPHLPRDIFPPAVNLEDQRLFSHISSAYSFAHEVLPKWISGLLPAPELVAATATAPIPTPPTLTPPQLKKALIALASQGMLTELPSDTPNLLIFNNATLA